MKGNIIVVLIMYASVILFGANLSISFNPLKISADWAEIMWVTTSTLVFVLGLFNEYKMVKRNKKKNNQ
jgi:hypothetical protein